MSDERPVKEIDEEMMASIIKKVCDSLTPKVLRDKNIYFINQEDHKNLLNISQNARLKKNDPSTAQD